MIRINLADGIDDLAGTEEPPQFNTRSKQWIGLGAVAALTTVITAAANLDAETSHHFQAVLQGHWAELSALVSSIAVKTAAIRATMTGSYQVVVFPPVANYAMRRFPNSHVGRAAVNQAGNVGWSVLEGGAYALVGGDPWLAAAWMGTGAVVPVILTELKMHGVTWALGRDYCYRTVLDAYNGTQAQTRVFLHHGRRFVNYLRPGGSE